MRRLRRHPEEGFSLIEVIVAMVMIGIVASSALYFFLSGMRTSSNFGRQQTAVSVATSAMERSFTLDPQDSESAGVSGLVVGRPLAAVTTAFDTVINTLHVTGVSDSYPMYDPAGGTPKLPITSTVTRAGTPYDVYTLVGSCYRRALPGGVPQDCTRYGNPPVSEPATPPPGWARMLRVTVVVAWTPLGDECSVKCHYDVSTLIDPSSNLVWNRVVDPAVVPDSWSYSPDPAAATATLNPLSNDVLGSVPLNPLKIVTPRSAIPGNLELPSSDGKVKYTPPGAAAGTWVSGIFPFTYQIRDVPGKTAQGTGTIYLFPMSVDDTATATVGIPKVLPILSNDPGSPVAVHIETGPSHGTAVAVGTTVTYTGNAAANDVFTYTYEDASHQVSPIATVRVSVQALSVSDAVKEVNYWKSAETTDGWVDISSALRGSADPAASITVAGAPSPSQGSATGGKLTVDGHPYTSGTLTGTTVMFQPPPDSKGEWTFPFALSTGTYTSPNVTATMQVWLAAINDPSSGTLSYVRNKSVSIKVGANDFPTNWGTGKGVIVTQGSISNNCGAWTNSGGLSTQDLALGQLWITTPNVSSTLSGCKATYTVSHGALSSTATITYNVTKN